jgi:hypothetical protein
MMVLISFFLCFRHMREKRTLEKGTLYFFIKVTVTEKRA